MNKQIKYRYIKLWTPLPKIKINIYIYIIIKIDQSIDDLPTKAKINDYPLNSGL